MGKGGRGIPKGHVTDSRDRPDRGYRTEISDFRSVDSRDNVSDVRESRVEVQSQTVSGTSTLNPLRCTFSFLVLALFLFFFCVMSLSLLF